jgi:CubicO group peptidase (beta-lactamase class C family)
MTDSDGIARALDRAIELDEQGIQVAAYVGGGLVVDAWAGTADPATGRAVTASTLFPVFSVTKAVTVTALHIQADRDCCGTTNALPITGRSTASTARSRPRSGTR